MSESPWWWLSFADAHKPRGSQNLGCAVVQADSLVEAVQEAHLMGCNPGGQVLGQPMPYLPRGMPINRLLTPAELEKFGESTRRTH